MFVSVPVQSLLDQGRGHKSIWGGLSQNLVSGGFDGSRFVDIDMTGFCTDDSLVGL